MRYLVTGGMGFIGSAVVRHLNAQGEDNVVVCDHLVASDKWRNLNGLRIRDLIDVSELEAVLKVDRFDVILHLGARTDTRERDLQVLHQFNFAFSKTVFEAALKKSARFIYASSAATYGDGSAGWSDQTSPALLRPLNPYGYYKNLFDWWVIQQPVRPPVCVGLKFFNVYGPGEAHKGPMASAILHFYQEMARGESIKLYRSLRKGIPDGMQRRDFVWVGDVVEVIWRLLDTRKPISSLLNVGSGVASTFLDILDGLNTAVGHQVAYEFIDMPDAIKTGYQYFSQADTTNVTSLGLSFTSLRDGIELYYKTLGGDLS